MPPKTATKPTTEKGKGKTSRVAKQSNGSQPVEYPELMAVLYTADSENGPLTFGKIQDLLGWVDGTEQEFGDNYLFTDVFGKRVRCEKNSKNRPFTLAHSDSLKQDALNRNWADSRNVRDDDEEPMSINGESIIINRYGDVDSGQHRLIGWGQAVQEWRHESLMIEQGKLTTEDAHWHKLWPDAEPTFECLIVYGVSGNPRVTRTLDNVKPRTISDVLYTDRDVFGTLKPAERVTVTRILEYAVRRLWFRTGAKNDAYNPHMTHSEALDFIERHPRIKAISNHVRTEDAGSKKKDKKLTNLGVDGPGGIAGMMYLQTYHDSDPEKYKEDPCEKSLGTKAHADKNFDSGTDGTPSVHDFWVKIVSGHKSMEGLRASLASLKDPNKSEPTRDEMMACVVKAWNLYKTNTPIDEDGSNVLEGLFNAEGELVRTPSVGGIDQGDPNEMRAEIKASERAEKEKTKEAEKACKKAEKEANDAEKEAMRAASDLKETYEKNPGMTLLWKGATEKSKGKYVVWGGDALVVGKLLDMEVEKHPENKLSKVMFGEKDFDKVVSGLHWADGPDGKGKRVGVVILQDGVDDRGQPVKVKIVNEIPRVEAE